LGAYAIPLFPYFTDVAGNYHDGPVAELASLKVECMYSNKSPFFNTLKDANAFLDDVLPYSNYTIHKKNVKIAGMEAEIYVSPMTDERVSILCIIEIPEKGLYAIYDELPASEFDFGDGSKEGYFD
ncbi:MAG: hypothetical protein K2N91_03660, partial [Muribaculaceae bacterium]|nr:hypothetical protein [Muribaculaceae bacterium]